MLRPLLTFLNGPLGRALRTVFSAGLVVLFLVLIDWRELSRLPAPVRWDLAIAGVLFAAAAYPLHGLRWHLLLRAQGLDARHGWTQAVSWIGGFYNSLLIGGVGGDAARAFYAVRDFPHHKAAALGSLAMDRVMGLLVLFGLCAGFLVALGPDPARDRGVESLSTLALVGIAALAAPLAIGLAWPAHRWPAPLLHRLGPERIAILAMLRQRTLTQPLRHGLALFWSVVIWGVDFMSIWLLAKAVGLPLPFLECSVAAAAAYVATVLPISIGGHGVREGTLLATLGALGLVSASGATREPALLLATAVWISTLACSLFGGLTLLAWRARAKPAPSTP